MSTAASSTSPTTPPKQDMAMSFHCDPAIADASLGIPIPTAHLDFHIAVDLNPKISVGPSEWGQRNWISFTGGQWTAKWGRGTVEVRPSNPSATTVTPFHCFYYVELRWLVGLTSESRRL